jgi:hypothetical protein
MSAAISFADVVRMLDECAPGHEITLRNHFRFVRWRGVVFPTLPKHDNIEIGHIKKMARTFGVLDCAKLVLGIR